MPATRSISTAHAAVITLAATCTFALFANTAHANISGVRATSTIGDIRDGGGQRNFTFDQDGGLGQASAFTAINDAITTDADGLGPWDRGSTRGQAQLTFGSNTPAQLKADAILTGNRSARRDPTFNQLPDGAVADTNLFASDLFQYTGSATTTLTLTFTLEGVVKDPDDGNSVANNLTELAAQVAVWADTPNYAFISDIGTLKFEFLAQLKQTAGVEAVDTTSLIIEDDTAGLTETRQATLAFDVNPGETFYVWQVMTAQAAFGDRSADAFSTLTAQFDQPQLVTSLSVPEPASIAILAIAGLALVHRRTRS